MNPTSGRNKGRRKKHAIPETKPPSARLPVSPIKTRAGNTLNTRNPSRLPITASGDGETPFPRPIDATEKKTAFKIVCNIFCRKYLNR